MLRVGGMRVCKVRYPTSYPSCPSFPAKHSTLTSPQSVRDVRTGRTGVFLNSDAVIMEVRRDHHRPLERGFCAALAVELPHPVRYPQHDV